MVISTQNWSILAKFAKKNPATSAVFYWLFLGEVSPWNFPWNQPIFLRICPWKSFEIWLFSTKIPRNRLIFLEILTFLPRKSARSANFSVNLPLKIPQKFASEALFSERLCKKKKKPPLPKPTAHANALIVLPWLSWPSCASQRLYMEKSWPS